MNYKTSLERTLPKLEERSPEKKSVVEKQRSRLKIHRERGGGPWALKLGENELCYHLKFVKKLRYRLLRENSGFSLFCSSSINFK